MSLHDVAAGAGGRGPKKKIIGRWCPALPDKMHGHKLVSMLPRWLVPPTRETCVGGPSQNEDIPLYLGVAV